MGKQDVTALLICLCLTTLATAQLSVRASYDPEAIVDAKTALQKWMIWDSRMKNLANEAVKILLPRIMEATSSLNISSPCMQSGMKMLTGLKKLKTWAVKFVDASAKSIDGIMGLTSASFGAFDECIDHKVINDRSGKNKGEILFQGKYCRVQLSPYLPPKPPMIQFTDRLEIFENLTKQDTVTGEMTTFAHFLYGISLVAGICVPSSCSKQDVNQLLHTVGDYIGMFIKATRCEIKQEKEFTPVVIGVIALYGFTGFLLVLSSLVDIYFRYQGKKVKGNTMRTLCAFSVITNFEKITDTSSPPGTFSCLNGIRFFTMSWIILSHTYLVLALNFQSMPKDFEQWMKGFNLQAILNGTFAVDTFFFMTGMLVCYSLIKRCKIGKKPFSFIMYVVHRLWRILPSYAFMIAFILLTTLMGSGPIFHETVDHFYQSCERNWWTNILFINNYYDPQNMCAPHGWYLAIDMQLYIGAIIILLPLIKKPKLGIALAVVITLASMITGAVQTYVGNYPPIFIITPDIEDQSKYMREIFIKPHPHIPPYCIGILCGYLLAMYPKIKIPKVLQVLFWCMTLVFSLTVVNGTQKWNGGTMATFWEKIFYSSCNRTAWSLAVAWVVVACCTGHGGIANRVLSWKSWIPLGRLSYMAFLVHPLVMICYVANERAVFHYEHHTVVWQFFGHLVVSYLVAVGGTLLVEAPFISLEKIVFSGETDKLRSEAKESRQQNQQNSTLNITNMKVSPDENNGIPNSNFVCKL